MDEYINILEDLSQRKLGNSSPKISDKNEYSKALKKLIRNEGISDRVAVYISKGFRYDSIKATMEVIAEYTDYSDKFNMLINKNIFKKDNTDMFKLLIHAFAMSVKINRLNNLLEVIISKIPSYVYSTKNKVNMSNLRYISKYILNDIQLMKIIRLGGVDIYALGIDERRINAFIQYIDEIFVEDNIKNQKVDADKVLEFSSWIKRNKRVIIERVKKDDETISINDNSKIVEEGIPKSITSDEPELASEMKKIKDINKTLVLKENEYKKQIEKLSMELHKLQIKCDSNIKCISDYAETTRSLKNEIIKKENIINVLENNIIDINENFDAFKLFHERKIEDVMRKHQAEFNKLSQQLKAEYNDFTEAKDLDMDADLGENMRIQLKNIFRILQRNGIDFK